jgi:hypothetical protein
MTTISKILKNPRPLQPTLRFTPTAWAKLLYLRDAGGTEVGGFGIATTADPLLVTDIELVDQECTAVSVVFDDAAVADFFDKQVDRGFRPAQFARIWVHTHPGNCANPSLTDEQTFQRAFGQTDWAVMFILANGGQTYCRLQYHVGPEGSMEPEIEVDFRQPFAGSDHPAWEAAYRSLIHELPILSEPKESAERLVDPDENLYRADTVAATALAIRGWDDDYLHAEEDWYDADFWFE